MRQHPIIFSGDMVRAILDGRKTQTRRVFRDPRGHEPAHPMSIHQMLACYPTADGKGFIFWDHDYPGTAEFTKKAYKNGGFRCPYGQPGDRLWCREKWGTSPNLDHVKPCDLPPGAPVYYAADDICDSGGWRVEHWRASIHMPRGCSRIMLEVARVRVQRVQDITEEDATAEGMCYAAGGCCEWCNGAGHNHTWPSGCPHCGGTGHSHLIHFQALWDRINLRRGCGWDASPWVWVIDFQPLPVAVRDA